GVRPAGQHARVRAGERGGTPDRRDGVAEIVLAVAEAALAVLPRLAPVNRGERNEPRGFIVADGAVPHCGVECAPFLERVTIRGIVINTRSPKRLALPWV